MLAPPPRRWPRSQSNPTVVCEILEVPKGSEQLLLVLFDDAVDQLDHLKLIFPRCTRSHAVGPHGGCLDRSHNLLFCIPLGSLISEKFLELVYDLTR